MEVVRSILYLCIYPKKLQLPAAREPEAAQIIRFYHQLSLVVDKKPIAAPIHHSAHGSQGKVGAQSPRFLIVTIHRSLSSRRTNPSLVL